MKRFFVLSFFLPLTVLAFAQSDSLQFRHFNKGKNIIGLQLSGGLGGGRVFVNSSLRYGRFWIKKFNAGLETGFSSTGIYYHFIYFKPFGRYYILKKKLSPFIETNYSYGFFRMTNERNGTTNSVSALGGLAYTGILRRFGIELYGGYFYSTTKIKSHPTFNSYYYNSDGFTSGLRINFHF